jgi:hypothetical protein
VSRVPRVLPAAAVALALTVVPAAGQETRAASIAEAQAAKATQLKPYVPSRGEQLAAGVKKHLFENPDGFYPYFDSVYSGGGFTLGAGYRKFYGDRTFLEARGLLSAKAYKLVELATESIGVANGVDFRATGGWRDATQVAYYGMGGDSSADALSNFRLKQAYVGGVLTGRGRAATVFKAVVSYEDFTLENGTGASPVIGDVHTKETAPSLGDNPAFLHTIWTGGFDTRPSPGYARRGGLYALSYESYVDTGDTYTFDGLQAEVVQHLPILRENWVVSLHGVARTTLDDGDTVPYFLLPSLGSGSTLRGYSSWRFRDRHSLLLSGEWRWIPNRMLLDMAIFYDAGKVASRLEDINFEGLKQDVGIGFRIHGPLMTPLRIDLARGSEGFNLVFSGAAAF